MLEKSIIKHCSPTLAGLKTANMFTYMFQSIDMMEMELQEQNEKLNEKGVFVEVLKSGKSKALIYVYRKKKLENDLRQEGVQKLLCDFGYCDKTCMENRAESNTRNCTGNCEACLEKLKTRFFQYENFPHEVGVFLGYPLQDVTGFIEQKGKNYKFSGPWKVYEDAGEMKKVFRRYEKCSEVYNRLFAGGRSITQLTVAA